MASAITLTTVLEQSDDATAGGGGGSVATGGGGGVSSFGSLVGVFVPRLPEPDTVVQAIPIPAGVTLEYDPSENAIGTAGIAPDTDQSAAFAIDFVSDDSTTRIGTLEWQSGDTSGAWTTQVSETQTVEEGDEVQILFTGEV